MVPRSTARASSSRLLRTVYSYTVACVVDPRRDCGVGRRAGVGSNEGVRLQVVRAGGGRSRRLGAPGGGQTAEDVLARRRELEAARRDGPPSDEHLIDQSVAVTYWLQLLGALVAIAAMVNTSAASIVDRVAELRL